jgi:diguanylate cyclase (GGDEF)-like protein
MSADLACRRVLVVVDPSPQLPLTGLFAAPALTGWEPVPADDFAAARFVLQHHPCDLLLVDETVYQREGTEAFHWLAGRHGLPAIVLSDTESAIRTHEQATVIWLPRALAVARPDLLAGTLVQAARLGDLERGQRRLNEALGQSRRQVDRLVGLLWRTLPQDADCRWLSQRHVLERLREEVSRAQRYGNPLTVALGELQMEGDATASLDWAAEQIQRGKRCCDVAGQYGPNGFLLLLVNTPAEGAHVCCRRLQQAVTAAPQGPHGRLRVHFGLATASSEPTSQNLLRRAEEQLEVAKAAGERPAGERPTGERPAGERPA